VQDVARPSLPQAGDVGELVAQPGSNEEPPCRDRSTDTKLDTEARVASVQDSGDGVGQCCCLDQVGPRLKCLRSERGLTLTDVAADSAYPTS
jgi:hypothetical protein